MRLSLQLVFELRWEYYLLDNEQYYKNAKTHHLSQLRISRKIKINLIIHYYMQFLMSSTLRCEDHCIKLNKTFSQEIRLQKESPT